MANLSQKIKEAVHSNAKSWTTVKKCFYTNAPQGTAYPYVSFFLINDTENGSDTGKKYFDVKLQFNVYNAIGDNGDGVETILDEIETNIKNLSINNFSVIDIKRDFKVPPIFIDKIWRGTIQFNIHAT